MTDSLRFCLLIMVISRRYACHLEQFSDVCNQCNHVMVVVCESDKEVIDFYWSYNHFMASGAPDLLL